MTENLSVESVIAALEKIGRKTDAAWADGHPDYVSEYSLTAEHIPALIRTATTCSDASSDDPAVYVQVHAWRALAQLRAVEAVQPLLEVQEELHERDDDWYLEEFHLVFGLIGPPAIEPLKAFLGDDSHTQFPREKAASGLCEISRRFPETRDQVIEILTAELNRHHDDGGLNGALVGNLLDLKAAEAIERAFAANVVDPTIAVDWGDVRRELISPCVGLMSIGLAGDCLSEAPRRNITKMASREWCHCFRSCDRSWKTPSNWPRTVPSS
ncbi:MAG: DUF1186 domain-containing protein [Planctomycetota bacterium]|nr:DUF1186 domain-containing protein [Planctomycetota bacterium]